MACQITSPFNKKIGSFCQAIFLILFAKTTQLIVEWEVIWQASDSFLSQELNEYSVNRVTYLKVIDGASEKINNAQITLY